MEDGDLCGGGGSWGGGGRVGVGRDVGVEGGVSGPLVPTLPTKEILSFFLCVKRTRQTVVTDSTSVFGLIHCAIWKC